LRIRITLMRIWILLFIFMRIRILLFTLCGSGSGKPADLDLEHCFPERVRHYRYTIIIKKFNANKKTPTFSLDILVWHRGQVAESSARVALTSLLFPSCQNQLRNFKYFH
jgi:hypothetical protein